ANDHVILVLRPGTQPLVRKIFGRSSQKNDALPTSLEFPLRASVTVGELQDLYGIQIDTSPRCTLDEAIRNELPDDEIRVGSEAVFESIALRVHRLAADGSIEVVSMAVRPE
ncbi:MAG: potassium/proton antiporter, partial [Planctomycetota bacterium]|nr:potassium/proton antiporter [Planctomycetota bacterium]